MYSKPKCSGVHIKMRLTLKRGKGIIITKVIVSGSTWGGEQALKVLPVFYFLNWDGAYMSVCFTDLCTG